MKNRHIILLGCALLLLATGCRSHREAARTAPQEQSAQGQPGRGPQETPGQTQPARARLLTASFTCSAQGVQASGQLRAASDSLIWASASKILELGRAELTPDSVLVYSRVLNRCFRGSYDDIYRRFHYRTSFKEIQSMLTADDADRQIAGLLKQLRLDAAVHIGPWKEAQALTFPFSIPSNARPI